MAPSLEKVNYLKEYRFVSNRRPWRRSLSPRNQLSETHEAFKAPEPLSEPKDLLGIKDFLLHEYDPHEFNKEKLAKNIEDKWGGDNLPPLGSEVMRQLDPYLTTNLKTHRSWHPEELKGYSKKDILTHWETNKTPKAWGYGLKNNPVTEENVPRQQFPMRDELKFKFETKIRRIPPPPVTVPHRSWDGGTIDSAAHVQDRV
ncbi:unnamed protein product [Dibothriocephalus latus]|uniref:Uncharacterized protein n=1 Tax=Dibothriocephalus latus TaxID=60516 RepID=A0A3P7LK13_DIBLA|nr:unnamed protein product [Dibothriocephalus latus]